MPLLSVTVITRDEAHRIERCLRSVAFADECIVLDSGSTDDTVEIARRCGARVHVTADWPGFGPQKNRALALATGDWVLSIDADEEVTGPLREAILAAVRDDRGVHGWWIRRSSSVYGGNLKVPFSETDPVDHPVSFYAATKRANELMAHSYAHLFGLPVTMLRYFTVYGPWGRPDMAIWKFTEGLLAGTPIDVYAGGGLSRDFTFVEDAAEATVRLLWQPPARTAGAADPGAVETRRPDTSWAPFEVFNVGRSDPTTVNELLALLEARTGARAQRRELPMQPGDVVRTCADPSKLRAATGFEPRVALADGLGAFVDWFRAWREGRA